MLFNQTTTPTLSSRNKQEIKQVSEYLGAWMSSSCKDIGVKKLKKIWLSGVGRTTKVRLFLSAVEPILMYARADLDIKYAITRREFFSL